MVTQGSGQAPLHDEQLASRTVDQAPLHVNQIPLQIPGEDSLIQFPPRSFELSPPVKLQQPTSGLASVQLQKSESGLLPSIAVIEAEKVSFQKESRQNVEAEIQRLEQEYQDAKNAFAAETETRKQGYFDMVEQNTRDHIKGLDAEHEQRVKEIMDTSEEYRLRLTEQVRSLVAQSSTQGAYEMHRIALASVLEELVVAREALQEEMRQILHGTSPAADAHAAIQVANARFEDRKNLLEQQRSDLDAELQVRIAPASPSAF